MSKYNAKKIEAKWQKAWAKNGYTGWHAAEKGKARKLYVLDMFPYPSGEGLHVGHVEGYTASDIISRYYRMRGYNVLHPMGWDAFGLPAENYAIKKKIHPAAVVKKNVANFKRQLKSIGFGYDWQREINTTDPGYYKWTQWIFLKLFKRGLAYEAEIPVNWCPSDKTVLANEEVIDGHCERCNSVVERKKLRQWVLKITAYADRLLKDLEGLDWPQKVKDMQINWIGRSEGAEIDFPVVGTQEKITVFTTRPDTLAGVSYAVIAPEHAFLEKLLPLVNNRKEVEEYIAHTKKKSDRERQENKEKTGVELRGVMAENPLTGKKVPVWISDYVLAQYGTGMVMAVPAHDQRDFEFAKKYNLPVTIVICSHYPDTTCPILDTAYEGPGHLVASGSFDGMPNEQAKSAIIASLASKKLAKEKITYKLRDWVFSRQRYWGEPIPIIKCPKCGSVPVPEKDLPVQLPKVKNYEPTGNAESPLAAIEKWVNVKCPTCKEPAKRETNTMPQWAGSCWYYLRFLDAKNKKAFADVKKEKYWQPVDVYIGGVEHAVLHLLYARFWHKVLFDEKLVSTQEPFQKLVNQGLILGPDGQKMSKSRGNVVNPDDLIKEFGADSLRLYEMFMGPLEDSKPWDPKGIIGLERFLRRAYALGEAVAQQHAQKVSAEDTKAVERALHKAIKKVTEDIEQYGFNTAISALMILLNEWESKLTAVAKAQARIFAQLLFPLAPHLGQEMWTMLGGKGLLDRVQWPTHDPKLIEDQEYELVIQINGRVREKITVPKTIKQSEAETQALAHPKIKEFLAGKAPKKIIFVPGRLINFVV